MKFVQFPPTVYVCHPDRKTIFGGIHSPINLNINYRFNTFSEMSFEISRYYYDERDGQWLKNPLYDKIEKNNLLKIPNEYPVYSYKLNELYNDSEYKLSKVQPDRYTTSPYSPNRLSFTPKFDNCALSDETLLFDVGSASGNGWVGYKTIHDGDTDSSGLTVVQTAGDIISDPSKEKIVCHSFLPVKEGDIVAMACTFNNDWQITDTGSKYFYYCPYFYTDNSLGSCCHIGFSNLNDSELYRYKPSSGRKPIESRFLGSFSYILDDEQITTNHKSGYMRLCAKAASGALPNAGFVRIYDGERRCSRIDVRPQIASRQFGIPWWVIANVETGKDGINPIKKVTAYSYEYTLTNRTFSVGDNVLPLYIPDSIPKTVTSSTFPIDKINGKTYMQAQRMKRGLLNQILDNSTGWRVRYVSKDVCTRYRQISDVDNANIYTYLMNTLQSLYQVYLIFDTENLYIDILNHEDLTSNRVGDGAFLSWRNALKSLTVKDIDDNYATALRIHSDDDKYGLSLVNPNGSDVIYNFTNVLSKMDYVVDEKHISMGIPYTLKSRVQEYQNGISDSSPDTQKYRRQGKLLIQKVMELSDLKIRLADRLTEYNREVDSNNALVKLYATMQKWSDDYNMSQCPPVDSEIQLNTGAWSYYVGSGGHHVDDATGSVRNCWASLSSFQAVQQATINYNAAKTAYNDCQKTVSRCITSMKRIALKYSLNINTLQVEYDTHKNSDGTPNPKYRPIFTPAEAKELYKYIYESDWTDENIIFNEEYSVDDIYNTLMDLYQTGASEMEHIYSKPTYEMEATVANLTRMTEMKKQCEKIYLGKSLNIYDDDKWIQPTLLEVKLDYSDYGSSPMVFTTDYNRKPKEMRFYELFSTINQTSIQTPTYTFDN